MTKYDESTPIGILNMVDVRDVNYVVRKLIIIRASCYNYGACNFLPDATYYCNFHGVTLSAIIRF